MKSIENIVWLASYPKSGNTWMRIFLNTIINGDKKEVSINEISITDGIVSNRALFEKWIGVDSHELTKSEIDNYLPRVLLKRSENLTERSFIKTHTANLKNENGVYFFPLTVTDKVIYIVRNPLDVAVSSAFHSGQKDFNISISTLNDKDAIISDNARLNNKQLHQYLSNWSGHYNSWIGSFPNEKLMVVRYEDMKRESFLTFGKVLEFLGISVSGKNLLTAIEKCSFENFKNQEDQHGFKERPSRSKSFFRKGVVGGWKNYLSQDQVNLIIEKHQEVMEELGYLQSDKQLTI